MTLRPLSLSASCPIRARLTVGFYERALGLLASGGVLGFVCADRWMLNQYGSNLRRLVTEGFGVFPLFRCLSFGWTL
jgi:hypothetical protein